MYRIKREGELPGSGIIKAQHQTSITDQVEGTQKQQIKFQVLEALSVWNAHQEKRNAIPLPCSRLCRTGAFWRTSAYTFNCHDKYISHNGAIASWSPWFPPFRFNANEALLQRIQTRDANQHPVSTFLRQPPHLL